MADTVVSDNMVGADRTARLDMALADTLTVETNALFSVTANKQTVRFEASANGAIINNSGTIENVHVDGDGRAIRFEDLGPSLTATINNIGASSIIRSGDDAVQIDDTTAVTAGTLNINNEGLIRSIIGEALDLAEGTGTFTVNITNTGGAGDAGDILAETSDAIRFGGVGMLVNSGVIDGGSGGSFVNNADGIQFEVNSSGIITNNSGGTISGDRHGINGAIGSVVNVMNNTGGTITGRNGSGVGLDGSGLVTNFGTITGEFTPGAVNGDGDGIDIDGQATIVNHGLILGAGAGGNGSDGLPNTAEGIAAGGGSITNNTGATIFGAGLGILIDNSSQGNAPFQTTIINDGTIVGDSSIVGGSSVGISVGIRIISTFADTITNNNTIVGTGGTAIQFGAGNNTLRIGTNSVISGLSDGQGGTNTLDYSTFGGASTTVNLATGVATGTGGVDNFQAVIGSSSSDNITGDDGNNVLTGGAGMDLLNGGAGNDTYNLEDGTDSVTDTGGTGDTITTTVTRSIMSFAIINRAYDNIENLTLLGSAAINGMGNWLNNVLTGNAAANMLFGSIGNDTLNGNGGNDTLMGEVGNDRLNGGLGADRLDAGSGTNNETGGAGNDIFVATRSNITATSTTITDFGSRHFAGADRIDLTGLNIGSLAAFQAVTANLGSSARMTTLLNGVASTLTVTGVPEASLVPGNFIFAGNVAQALNGTANADDLFGAGGNDTLNGGAGNDRLFGESHNDTLRGSNGNDILIGGLGRDIMIGGANNDIFSFVARADSAVTNPDVITDFDDFGNDRIDVSALFGPALAYRHNAAFTRAGQVRINDVAGPDVIVQVNTGGTLAADFAIRLTATTLGSMTASDFIL